MSQPIQLAEVVPTSLRVYATVIADHPTALQDLSDGKALPTDLPTLFIGLVVSPPQSFPSPLTIHQEALFGHRCHTMAQETMARFGGYEKFMALAQKAGAKDPVPVVENYFSALIQPDGVVLTVECCQRISSIEGASTFVRVVAPNVDAALFFGAVVNQRALGLASTRPLFRFTGVTDEEVLFRPTIRVGVWQHEDRPFDMYNFQDQAQNAKAGDSDLRLPPGLHFSSTENFQVAGEECAWAGEALATLEKRWADEDGISPPNLILGEA